MLPEKFAEKGRAATLGKSKKSGQRYHRETHADAAQPAQPGQPAQPAQFSQPVVQPTPHYLPRYADVELAELWGEGRAFMLEGVKGCGKTQTALGWVPNMLFLDDPELRQLVAADTAAALSQNGVVGIDEWQLLPQVIDYVRRQVDAKTQRKFLLTGSAMPRAGVDAHSGAGRLLGIRMRPLALSERAQTTPTIFIEDLFEGQAQVTGETSFALADYAHQICASGFPEVNGASSRLQRHYLQTYIQRLLDRDLATQGLAARKPQSLRAWLTAYGGASSTVSSYEAILNAASANDSDKPSKSATLVYRDFLAQLWVLDPVPAWSPALTPLGRLTGQAKHQLVDPALAASLLNVSAETLLSGTPGTFEMFGQLFESLATMTVRAAGQYLEAQTYHLRTRAGLQEIDLILERYDGAVLAFEVKLAATIADSDVKHLHWLGEKIGSRLVDKVVIYTGRYAYRRPDGVAVIPLAMLA